VWLNFVLFWLLNGINCWLGFKKKKKKKLVGDGFLGVVL
jgi:hypothetical protein